MVFGIFDATFDQQCQIGVHKVLFVCRNFELLRLRRPHRQLILGVNFAKAFASQKCLKRVKIAKEGESPGVSNLHIDVHVDEDRLREAVAHYHIRNILLVGEPRGYTAMDLSLVLNEVAVCLDDRSSQHGWNELLRVGLVLRRVVNLGQLEDLRQEFKEAVSILA